MKPLNLALISLVIILALSTAFLAGKLSSSQQNTSGMLTPQQKAKQTVDDITSLNTELKSRAEQNLLEAQQRKTLSDAKQIGMGLILYAEDHDEKLPPSETAQSLISSYIPNVVPEVFQPVGSFPHMDSPVGWHTDSKPLSSFSSPPEAIIAFKLGPSGRANIYADGHARWKND